jgi:hypothetical protein
MDKLLITVAALTAGYLIANKSTNSSALPSDGILGHRIGESWFCKANPKDWRCNPTARANNTNAIRMESWFCKANPRDPKCNPVLSAAATPVSVVLTPAKRIGAPYNPDTGYSPNYATGGFPYSM